MTKEDNIKKYFLDLANKYDLCPREVIITEGNKSCVIAINIKSVDSDDLDVNEFYCEIRKITKELKYFIAVLGSNALFGDTEGVSITMGYDQYQELKSSDLFRSVLGLNKFNI